MDEAQLQKLGSQRKTKRLRRILFAVVVAGALLAMLFAAVSKHFFVVSEIVIQESSFYSYDEILDATGLQGGTPLLEVPRKEICLQTEQKLNYIFDVELKFTLPGTVSVSFREAPGDMYLKLGGEYFVVDENLWVIAREGKLSQTHRIEMKSGAVSRCIVGEKLKFRDRNMETILSELIGAARDKEMIGKIDSFDVTDKFNIEMELEGRFSILLGEAHDIPYKLSMILQVLEELEPGDAGEIDIANSNMAYVRLYNKIR